MIVFFYSVLNKLDIIVRHCPSLMHCNAVIYWPSLILYTTVTNCPVSMH